MSAMLWAATALGAALHHGPWLILAGLALVIYLGLRFCLAGPIGFAERRIDFPRSWRLTRGRVLALLGMSALSFCLIGLLLVVVRLVLSVIAFSTAGLDGLAGLFSGPETLRRHHPGLFVLEFGADIVLTPVLWVLGVAPVIAAYRALSAPSGEAPSAD
jgi:hypothetical protein